jgi:type I restriction enzyme S subunit
MARGKKAVQGLTPEEKLAQVLVPAEEQPYQIPDNWCWIHLPEAFTNHTDSKKKIQSKAYLSEGKYSVVDQGQELIGGYTDDKDMLYSGKLPVIIFGDHTRCVKLIDFPFVQGADGVKVLRPKDFYDINAFYYSLRAINIPNLGYRRHFPLFSQFAIPLPPLNEQQRIVDRIERIFAKMDEAKEKAQAVVDGFELRKSAILHKAFTGELTEKWREEHGVTLDSWEKETSTQLFSYVTSGSRGWAQYYSDSGSVFIRMGNLDHGTVELDMEDIQYVNLPSKAEGQRSKLQKNDILISITADIGMIGLVRNADQDMYINQHIALARPTEENSAEFIAWYLVSDVGLKQMQSKQRGATKIGLGLDDIRNLKLLMPQVNEQAEIVRVLDSLLAKENAAKEAAESVLDQIDTMKKAVLARAFRGELGTNDPEEESAVELLKTML